MKNSLFSRNYVFSPVSRLFRVPNRNIYRIQIRNLILRFSPEYGNNFSVPLNLDVSKPVHHHHAQLQLLEHQYMDQSRQRVFKLSIQRLSFSWGGSKKYWILLLTLCSAFKSVYLETGKRQNPLKKSLYQWILSFLLFLETFRIEGVLLFLLFLDTFGKGCKVGRFKGIVIFRTSNQLLTRMIEWGQQMNKKRKSWDVSGTVQTKESHQRTS